MDNENNVTEKPRLNIRQEAFCRYYVETGNGTQSAIKAGYTPGKNNTNAAVQADHLLRLTKIKEEIARIQQKPTEKHIATAQEVMQFFTDMMQGKIKDQFGLDATNGDRLKAAQEIAKRTVDIENRSQGKADARVEIALDWRRDDNER